MDSLVSQVQNNNSQMTYQSKGTEKQASSMCEYLKDHIVEELEGAVEYMTKALELKETHPEWAKKFYKMAEMETEHANCMNKIFASMGESEFPCHDSLYREVLESYTKEMTEYSTLKQMYWS